MVGNEQIKTWIETGLPGAHAEVTGDGQHFEALVICNEFAGKNTLARHRMVNAALGERMGREIHALSLRVYTESEYNSQNN